MRRVAEQAELAAEAYIYRYLPVRSLDEIAASVAGGGSLPIQAPYNEFGHARNLASPEGQVRLAPAVRALQDQLTLTRVNHVLA